MNRIKSIISIMLAAISITLASCVPMSQDAVEATEIFRAGTILYHVSYRGHELIVNSNGGIIELTTNPFDTYKESTK